jgi:hypothetical protein
VSAHREVGGDAGLQALRLIEDVQTLGLSCAAAVADRYVGLVDRYLGQRAGSPGGRADAAGEAALVEVAERMAQVWSRSADVLATALSQAAASPDASPQGEVLHLPPARAGTSSTRSLWVHNPTPEPVSVTIRVSALVSADGRSLPPGSVVLEPAGDVPVRAGGAAEVRVRALVPPSTPPGHVHGLLTSTAAPSQALALHLEVLPEAGRP